MTECNAKRGAATAVNRGKWCRCGRGTDGEYRSESLWSGHGGEDHTATAAKCGKRCRCGVSPRGQCCSESLRRGARHERVAATAVNRVKSCRCGKMGRSEAGIDVRTSYRALLGAVRRVYSFGRSGKMVWFRDSFGRSGEGTDVRTSYRALLWTVRRVYSFGRSREMVWFRDSFGRSGKMVWFREPFGWSMEWNTAVWCSGSGCASTHLRKVSGKRGETAHLRKVG